jgi:hypothetical protein
MVKMIIRLFLIRLLLPNLSKYAADYVADFLQRRREARRVLKEKFTDRLGQQNGIGDERSKECPPCPPLDDTVRVANTASRVWLALSGLLLGGAIGLMAYLFVKDSRTH